MRLAQQIVGPEPREATFASSLVRRSCSVTPWPGQLKRYAATILTVLDMFLRGLVCAVIGIFGGGAAGALTFGWDTSMFVGSSWMGPARNWWTLAAIVGALGGAAFGLILGLVICLANIGKGLSAILGCMVGIVGVAVMESLGESVFYWQMRSVTSRFAPPILSLILWTLLAQLLAAAANNLSKT